MLVVTNIHCFLLYIGRHIYSHNISTSLAFWFVENCEQHIDIRLPSYQQTISNHLSKQIIVAKFERIKTISDSSASVYVAVAVAVTSHNTLPMSTISRSCVEIGFRKNKSVFKTEITHTVNVFGWLLSSGCENVFGQTR